MTQESAVTSLVCCSFYFQMMKSDLQYVALIEMQMFRFFGVILDLGEKQFIGIIG